MGYQLHPCYSSFIAFGAKISLESITPTSPPLSGLSLLVYVLAIPTLIFPFVQFPRWCCHSACILRSFPLSSFDHSSLYINAKRNTKETYTILQKILETPIRGLIPSFLSFHNATVIYISFYFPNIWYLHEKLYFY